LTWWSKDGNKSWQIGQSKTWCMTKENGHIRQTQQCKTRPKVELHIHQKHKIENNSLYLKFKGFKGNIVCYNLFHAQRRCRKAMNPLET
jgi:hypothetical protein